MRFDRGMRGEFGQRRVAVIGAGISGMSAAWLLGKSLEVVLYEAGDKPGGHANTVLAPTAVGPVPVDTGFIVYNDRNYPNLVALFDHLDVPTQASNMSFSASLDGGAFEYSGSGLTGLFGQPLNALRPRFWRILSDILRFYREAPKALNRLNLASKTLGSISTRMATAMPLLPIISFPWALRSGPQRPNACVIIRCMPSFDSATVMVCLH